LAARVKTYVEGADDIDVAALYTALGAYRSRALGTDSASERALALLGAADAATHPPGGSRQKARRTAP
jgi:hypothetical protein